MGASRFLAPAIDDRAASLRGRTLVPQGHPTIARRFNAGITRSRIESRPGRLRLEGPAVPSGLTSSCAWRVRLKVAGTRWWVLSRCDKTSPRRAGGSAVVKDAPSTHGAALRGATARSASSSTPRSARHFQSLPRLDPALKRRAILISRYATPRNRVAPLSAPGWAENPLSFFYGCRHVSAALWLFCS